MSNKLKRPRVYDAVLGNQYNPHANAVVLGGIEGVKQRLASQVIEEKISALSEALNYDAEGLTLVIQALNDHCEQVHFAAYNLLKHRKESEIKTALDKYVKQSHYIRFDGLYYSRSQSNNYYLLRFYQDKIVIDTNVFSGKQDFLEKTAEWFYPGHNQFIYQGIYQIEDNSLKFSIVSGQSAIDYQGEIDMYGYSILLTCYCRTRRYNFINVPNLK
ncbi:hypothetical protein CAL7716_082560 [Calothrix sp. PCC 7716]|nr:hypothetical protein CAL7716_082560 [Calothrix sp. PCC 7716]